MPRAKRTYTPGLLWHVTQRCQNREFLLKFARDKRAWRTWMVEARERYGLCALNYTITSNHVHLQLLDRGGLGRGEDHDRLTIVRSLHLGAGRTAQEYNERKGRTGPFWEDRYHATAIETGEHFTRCVSYVDLNMVRAGVVRHPGEWPFGAYHELFEPRTRFRKQLVDWEALLDLLGMKDIDELRRARIAWIEAAVRSAPLEREARWTESVAVGSKGFVEEVALRLGPRAKGRTIEGAGNAYVLLEEPGIYSSVFEANNEEIRAEAGTKE